MVLGTSVAVCSARGEDVPAPDNPVDSPPPVEALDEEPGSDEGDASADDEASDEGVSLVEPLEPAETDDDDEPFSVQPTKKRDPVDDDEAFSDAPVEDGDLDEGPDEHVSVEGPFERPAVEKEPTEDWWVDVIDFGNGLKFSTPEALHWRSPNKRVRMRLGGRIHWDYTWGNDDGLGYSVRSGNRLRRARVYVEGDIDKRLDFRGDIDFAGSGTHLRDFYLRFRKLPAIDFAYNTTRIFRNNEEGKPGTGGQGAGNPS